MAAPDKPGKINPKTALVVVAVVAAGAYLYMRARGGATGAAGTSTAGTVTSSTTYGLGPEWFTTWVRQHQGPPRRRGHKDRDRGTGRPTGTGGSMQGGKTPPPYSPPPEPRSRDKSPCPRGTFRLPNGRCVPVSVG